MLEGEPEGSQGRVNKNKVRYSVEERPLRARGEIAIDDYGSGHHIEENQLANYKIGIHSQTDGIDPLIRDNSFDGVGQEVLIDGLNRQGNFGNFP